MGNVHLIMLSLNKARDAESRFKSNKEMALGHIAQHGDGNSVVIFARYQRSGIQCNNGRDGK